MNFQNFSTLPTRVSFAQKFSILKNSHLREYLPNFNKTKTEFLHLCQSICENYETATKNFFVEVGGHNDFSTSMTLLTSTMTLWPRFIIFTDNSWQDKNFCFGFVLIRPFFVELWIFLGFKWAQNGRFPTKNGKYRSYVNNDAKVTKKRSFPTTLGTLSHLVQVPGSCDLWLLSYDSWLIVWCQSPISGRLVKMPQARQVY